MKKQINDYLIHPPSKKNIIKSKLPLNQAEHLLQLRRIKIIRYSLAAIAALYVTMSSVNWSVGQQ